MLSDHERHVLLVHQLQPQPCSATPPSPAPVVTHTQYSNAKVANWTMGLYGPTENELERWTNPNISRYVQPWVRATIIPEKSVGGVNSSPRRVRFATFASLLAVGGRTSMCNECLAAGVWARTHPTEC